MTQLAGQMDAVSVDRMRAYLTKTMPPLLGVDTAAVAVTIDVGVDSIGIAAMSKSGQPAATSGAKSDCIANPKQWAADRCNEITTQWGQAYTAAQAAAAPASKAAVGVGS